MHAMRLLQLVEPKSTEFLLCRALLGILVFFGNDPVLRNMRVHPVNETAISVSFIFFACFYPATEQAAEKQVSSLRKERDAAQARVDKAVRGLESLGYDKGQEDGLDGEKEQEEKAVDRLKEVRLEGVHLLVCRRLRRCGHGNLVVWSFGVLSCSFSWVS